MYYQECPYCGANLDPGEVCDCIEERKKREAAAMLLAEKIGAQLEEEENGQFRMAV